ncbi:MAG: hypothetical protein HQL20_08325 [Candidatus Omnitrophica bacterium]|nr:hypothetical protein [Candidatus Omnitrophota bacterium]
MPDPACPLAALWAQISRDGIRVPKEVWAAWFGTTGASVNEIRAIAGSMPGEPISLKQANEISIRVNLLARVFKDIRRSPNQDSRVEAGMIILNPTVKDLMAHYVGNNLYKIALMVDVYEQNPAPVAAEVRGKTIACLDAIDVFIKRLEQET